MVSMSGSGGCGRFEGGGGALDGNEVPSKIERRLLASFFGDGSGSSLSSSAASGSSPGFAVGGGGGGMGRADTLLAKNKPSHQFSYHQAIEEARELVPP